MSDPTDGFDPALLEVVGTSGNATLATIRGNGRPQLSVVSYAWSPSEHAARISTRSTLAKVANLRRDPRVSLSVTSDSGWSYAVVEGRAELSTVAQAPDDATVEALVDLYRAIGGKEHPDWDEYRAAMVADQRLVLTVVAERVYGLRQD